MQIKDSVFLFPPESGFCFLEGPGEGDWGVAAAPAEGGVGAPGGPSPWILAGTLGLLLFLLCARARSCEGAKQPQAESRILFCDCAWLFEPRDTVSTCRLHRLGWQSLCHGRGGGQCSSDFINEAGVPVNAFPCSDPPPPWEGCVSSWPLCLRGIFTLLSPLYKHEWEGKR